MSNPPCQSEDGNAAVFTGTNFDTGQSVMLCSECLVSFCAAIVEGMTGLPVAALLDSATASPDDGSPALDTGDDSDGEVVDGDGDADLAAYSPEDSGTDDDQ